MRQRGPIVIVDDDLDDQYLYKKAFEKMNLEEDVVTFDNGADALEYLKRPAVDPFLILCDINMPMMNGLQMREAMCAQPVLRKKNTPFIFMSTSARRADIDKACSLYTHGFFEKQMSYEKHEALLKKIIEYWAGCRYCEKVIA
jgi:CheY-like chemotaxis protein